MVFDKAEGQDSHTHAHIQRIHAQTHANTRLRTTHTYMHARIHLFVYSFLSVYNLPHLNFFSSFFHTSLVLLQCPSHFPSYLPSIFFPSFAPFHSLPFIFYLSSSFIHFFSLSFSLSLSFSFSLSLPFIVAVSFYPFSSPLLPFILIFPSSPSHSLPLLLLYLPFFSSKVYDPKAETLTLTFKQSTPTTPGQEGANKLPLLIPIGPSASQ